eukprot:scaffold5046_cov403-Prasinococcus_capsulatus_cf.AAC.4
MASSSSLGCSKNHACSSSSSSVSSPLARALKLLSRFLRCARGEALVSATLSTRTRFVGLRFCCLGGAPCGVVRVLGVAAKGDARALPPTSHSAQGVWGGWRLPVGCLSLLCLPCSLPGCQDGASCLPTRSEGD